MDINLEIKKGAVANNIEGTAVARDLFEMLKLSKTAFELLKKHDFKITLTKDFTLKIYTY